jgi:Domain of unknown function (DUF4407)
MYLPSLNAPGRPLLAFLLQFLAILPVFLAFPLQPFSGNFILNLTPICMTAPSNGRQNGHFMYDQFSGNAKNNESHFLWWCSGAHQQLLKEFPSEHAKYAGLGGVILATFALASLSAGYAVHTVFDNLAWSVAFGLLWGLIIFNLDRFLVSTMRKYGVSHWRQLAMTVPRVVLALLISITIARPLELKIFEKEVDVKVAENRHKKILLNDSLLQQEHNHAVLTAQTERDRLSTRKQLLEDTLRHLQQAYVQEADGTGGSLHRGIEQLTRLKLEAYQSALARFSPEWQQLGRQIGYQDSILETARVDLGAKRKQYEAELTARVGFLERNKALADLSEQENSVFWANLFISLLVIVIETGPILAKLIMNVGPYDLALAKTELLQMAESENEMQKHKHLHFDRLNELYKKKKQISEELNAKLTDLQSKHIDLELERWERGEKSVDEKTSIDELMKRITERYRIGEDHVL